MDCWCETLSTDWLSFLLINQSTKALRDKQVMRTTTKLRPMLRYSSTVEYDLLFAFYSSDLWCHFHAVLGEELHYLLIDNALRKAVDKQLLTCMQICN